MAVTAGQLKRLLNAINSSAQGLAQGFDEVHRKNDQDEYIWPLKVRNYVTQAKRDAIDQIIADVQNALDTIRTRQDAIDISDLFS